MATAGQINTEVIEVQRAALAPHALMQHKAVAVAVPAANLCGGKGLPASLVAILKLVARSEDEARLVPYFADPTFDLALFLDADATEAKRKIEIYWAGVWSTAQVSACFDDRRSFQEVAKELTDVSYEMASAVARTHVKLEAARQKGHARAPSYHASPVPQDGIEMPLTHQNLLSIKVAPRALFNVYTEMGTEACPQGRVGFRLHAREIVDHPASHPRPDPHVDDGTIVNSAIAITFSGRDDEMKVAPDEYQHATVFFGGPARLLPKHPPKASWVMWKGNRNLHS